MVALSLIFSELDSRRRIVWAKILGNRKVEKGAQGFQPISRSRRLHATQLLNDVLLLEHGDTVVAVLLPKSLKNVPALRLRTGRELGEGGRPV